MKPITVVAFIAVLVVGVLLGRSCSPQQPAAQVASVGSIAPPPRLQLKPSLDAMRRDADLLAEPVALPLARVQTTDVRRARN